MAIPKATKILSKKWKLAMNKRERLINVLENRPVDYVPVLLFHHFCDEKDWDQGLVNSAAFEKNIIEHKNARKVFDPDVIKVMNDTLMMLPVDLSFIREAADLQKIKPFSMDCRFIKKSVELTKRSLECFKDSDAPIYTTAFSPSYTLRWFMRDREEDLLQFIEEDPSSLAIALRSIAKSLIEFNRVLIEETDVDGFYYCVNNQNNFFEDSLFNTHVAPYEKVVLEKANELSDINILHICGYDSLSNDLKLFKDFEAAAFNWDVHAEGVSLTEGKKLFGGKAVIGGFKQDQVIYTGTREEVEKATFDILTECGQIGTIIGAGCTLPTDIEEIRLEWVRKASIKYATVNP